MTQSLSSGNGEKKYLFVKMSLFFEERSNESSSIVMHFLTVLFLIEQGCIL